ncbi:MAG: hypothetical protein QNJ47_15300 [Nostocaceae cyanobacterium]|nr:hypothetical protein [Nostocaceae cyanobacterium]
MHGEEEKFFAVKTFLVDSLLAREINPCFGDEINLLELAEKMVHKLADILGKR